MTIRLIQAALMLTLAACGSSSSSSTTAQPTTSSGRPFSVTPVTTFESPWAMAFLPGSNMALVTEKPGHVWMVDVSTGRKQQVSGVPAVLYGGQGGLLDVVLSPTFGADSQV